MFLKPNKENKPSAVVDLPGITNCTPKSCNSKGTRLTPLNV